MDSGINPAQLLRKYGLRPQKQLGQNFLMDDSALSKVVNAAEVSAQDEVLEIGAGLGSLTWRLAQHARQVVAVEKDTRLLPPLQEALGGLNNVRVVAGDMLALDPAVLMPANGYLVVANIPYYITSALIRHLLSASMRPARMVLTMQREVAQRICAPVGQLSLLALSVQVFGKASVQARIPAGAFYPAPKVDSAVLRVDVYPQPVIGEEQLDVFFRLIKAGFGQKRKNLRNALSGGLSWSKENIELILAEAGISPQERAQNIGLPDWQRLTQAFIRVR